MCIKRPSIGRFFLCLKRNLKWRAIEHLSNLEHKMNNLKLGFKEGDKILKRFNDWLGDKLAHWLCTMAMFYIITAMVMVPLFFQRPVGLVGWMQYAISVFFQGAALPVLGYVANRAGEKQERVLNETHDTVMEELTLIKEDLALAREQRDELEALMTELRVKIPNANKQHDA